MKTNSNVDDLEPRVLIDLCHKMLLIRQFEEKIISVYAAQDMKTPVHLCIGQEAIAAGVCANLAKNDFVFSTHRNHGHYLAKGVAPKDLLSEFYGRKTGCCKGKGGSMHPTSPEHSILGTSAIVGGGIPLAVGTALASRLKNDDRVSVVFFGDGASEEGTFHESMNFASLKRLPVILICENNLYATNSHLSARQPSDNISKRADGYGIPGFQVNGNDVIDVYRVAREAVRRARNEGGPTLIECKTYRWKGHVGPDCDHEKGCRPREELDEWQKMCPLKKFEEYLLNNKIITEHVYKRMQSDIDAELESAVKFARESPFPQLTELFTDLYFVRT